MTIDPDKASPTRGSLADGGSNGSVVETIGHQLYSSVIISIASTLEHIHHEMRTVCHKLNLSALKALEGESTDSEEDLMNKMDMASHARKAGYHVDRTRSLLAAIYGTQRDTVGGEENVESDAEEAEEDTGQ